MTEWTWDIKNTEGKKVVIEDEKLKQEGLKLLKINYKRTKELYDRLNISEYPIREGYLSVSGFEILFGAYKDLMNMFLHYTNIVPIQDVVMMDIIELLGKMGGFIWKYKYASQII